MTSFAGWLVPAALALSTPNRGGGRLALALGEGVNVVVISNPFVNCSRCAACAVEPSTVGWPEGSSSWLPMVESGRRAWSPVAGWTGSGSTRFNGYGVGVRARVCGPFDSSWVLGFDVLNEPWVGGVRQKAGGPVDGGGDGDDTCRAKRVSASQCSQF